MHITDKDFSLIFNATLSDFVKEKIKGFNFLARNVSSFERDEILLKILKTLLDTDLTKAGNQRKDQWEKGWKENLQAYTKHEEESIIPRYFGKHNIARWKQNFVITLSPNFEYNMLATIQYWLFDTLLRSYPYIYEFGCGTGHNLLRVREVNKSAKLWGLDWAQSSQNLVEKISLQKSDPRLFAKNFDFFSPDKNFKLNKKSAVFTVAALEQIGSNFKPFIDYLLEEKPKICIHIEPIFELLDEKNLIDYLSTLYFKKRNYLKGFLSTLRTLEKQKKIKIHAAKRSYIGSLYIEGYSIVIWSPLT